MFMRSFAAVAALTTLVGCMDTTTTTTAVVMANRNVLINNQSGATVYRFYGSNSIQSTWGADLLGANVIPNGRSMNINFADGTNVCSFDFKIELTTGRVIEDYNVNVCRIASYTVR